MRNVGLQKIPSRLFRRIPPPSPLFYTNLTVSGETKHLNSSSSFLLFSLCRPKSLLDVFARCAFSRDLGSGSFSNKKRLPGAWNRTPPPLKPDFLIAGRGWKSLRRRDERIRGDTGNGDVELSHRVSSKKTQEVLVSFSFCHPLYVFSTA